MRAWAKDHQEEDNAFKALEAIATTSSEHYKDDMAYEQYKKTHADLPKREKDFLKALIHFQTLGLQIFERNQSQVKKLEAQLKSQEEVNKALERSMDNEIGLRQRVHDLEHQLQ